MGSGRVVSALVACGLLSLAARHGPAQQVTVGTPFHTLSDSFFERTGVNFNFNLGRGVDRPFMVFGRPVIDPLGDPAAGPMRNLLDVDHGRSAVVGMQAPGVFSPDLRVPFAQNSFGPAVPQFGGYQPGAGMTGGFHVRHRGFNWSLNWEASQGYRQSLVSQTPSITLMNGQTGFISDTSQSPFVISYIPVVGGIPRVPYPYATMAYPGYTMAPGLLPAVPADNRVQAFRRQQAMQNQADAKQVALRRAAEALAQPPAPANRAPQKAAQGDLELAGPAAAAPAVRDDGAGRKLASAQASSAGRAAPSVAEARRLHQLEQAAQENEARALLERGLTAEEGGKPKLAKIYYNMAIKRAEGKLRGQVQARLDALRSPPAP